MIKGFAKLGAFHYHHLNSHHTFGESLIFLCFIPVSSAKVNLKKKKIKQKQDHGAHLTR